MMPDAETLVDRLAKAIQFLPDKPEETPESTLRALWLTASGQPVSAEQAMELVLPELDASQAATLESLIAPAPRPSSHARRPNCSARPYSACSIKAPARHL